jgi:hypothetical protein
LRADKWMASLDAKWDGDDDAPFAVNVVYVSHRP